MLLSRETPLELQQRLASRDTVLRRKLLWLAGAMVLILFSGFPLSSAAQNYYCAHGNVEGENQVMGKSQAMTSVNVPTSGQFRALIVFVRFKDDTYNSSCSGGRWSGWHTSDLLPDMAHDFLMPATTGGQAPYPPYDDDSLTEYFYQQSDQNFIMYGEPYEEVVETQYNESHYQISGTGSTSRQGMAELTEEVLDYVEAQGFDFTEYDNDGPDGVPNTSDDDGYIDHIFIVPRRFSQPPTWSGWSILGDASEPILTYDGKEVDWNLSGSYNRFGTPQNIIPLLTLGRLMAHEFGHDVWGFSNLGGVHLQAITTNDVPSNGTNRVGYSLMAGSNGADDMAGTRTISAFERDVLGWIDCSSLQSDANGVELDHLYSSGDCRTIDLGNSSSGKTLYLSNLQHGEYFDDQFIYDPSCFYAEAGLHTTGLLIGVKEGSGSSTEYDELPADNTLDIDIVHAPYQGDLYSPSTSTQITPWTRPNINGYTEYPGGYNPSWEAVDNIRYASGSSGPMLFDYLSDFRNNPIVREDSWIGDETSGVTLSGDLVVESGATLTINSNVTLKFAAGAGILVYGTLMATEVDFVASSTSWSGIEFMSGSSGSITGGRIDDVDNLAAVKITDSSPTIENVSLHNPDAGNAFHVTGYSSYPTFTGNRITGSTRGFTFDQDGRGLLDENEIDVSYAAVQAQYYGAPKLRGYPQSGGSNILKGDTYGIAAWYSASVDAGAGPYSGSNHFCSENNYHIYSYQSTVSATGNYWPNGSVNWGKIYDNPSGSVDASSIGTSNCVLSKAGVRSELASGESTFMGRSVSEILDLLETFRRAYALAAQSREEPGPDKYRNEAIRLFKEIISEHAESRAAQAAVHEVWLLSDGTEEQRTYIEELTLRSDSLRPFALGVLVQAYQVWGETKKAKASASQLAAEYNGTWHALYADMSRFWMEIKRGDHDSAEAILLSVDPLNERETAIVSDAFAYLGESDSKDRDGVNGDPYVEASGVSGDDKGLSIEAYPNPFNPQTTIRFELPVEGAISLRVFDALGRVVEVLVDGVRPKGVHEVTLDGTALPSGLYLYRLKTEAGQMTGNILLAK